MTWASRSTADGRVIFSYLRRLRPERRDARTGKHIRWGNLDVYVPAVASLYRGLPVLLDVRVVRGDSSKRAEQHSGRGHPAGPVREVTDLKLKERMRPRGPHHYAA